MAQVSFPTSRENTPCAAAVCGRATKSPARHPARAADVLSVNTLFWRILVTRVKRKVGEFGGGVAVALIFSRPIWVSESVGLGARRLPAAGDYASGFPFSSMREATICMNPRTIEK